MMGHVSRATVGLVCGGLLIGFGGGVLTGRALYATSINGGLVNAFTSVGQNLFGEGVFGARTLPPSPILPAGAVQIDLSSASQIPVKVGVFLPPNPIVDGQAAACRRFAELAVTSGGAILSVDSAYAPGGFEVQYRSLQETATAVPAVCGSGIGLVE